MLALVLRYTYFFMLKMYYSVPSLFSVFLVCLFCSIVCWSFSVKLFSEVIDPFYIFTSILWKFHLFHIFATIRYGQSFFFYEWYLNKCIEISHCDFTLYFPNEIILTINSLICHWFIFFGVCSGLSIWIAFISFFGLVTLVLQQWTEVVRADILILFLTWRENIYSFTIKYAITRFFTDTL